jgi:dolichol-phosphate hexosyltransferase
MDTVSAGKTKISIVIPTLNEQEGIKRTLKSIKETLGQDTLNYEVEIIVVDGDSIDSTRDVATKMGAQVLVEKRKGYGRALKSGFAAARGDVVVTLDADNTYPSANIPNYIEELKNRNLDFITVNRFSHIERGAMSPINRVGNRLLTLVTRVLYSVNIEDSQSGMWIMKNSFISQVELDSDGMSLSEEIKIIAFKFFSSAEIDGEYYARTGKAKINVIRDGWKNLKYLFDYRKKIDSAVTSSFQNKGSEISLKD